MRAQRVPLVLLSLALLAVWLSACSRAAASPAASSGPAAQEQDLRAQAAAEATAIIQRAEATALVLQAQAQATALIQQAQALESTPLPQVTLPPRLPTPTPGVPAAESPLPPTATEVGEAAETADDAAAVELLGVGFGADGAFIVVNYRASPQVAQKFWPGVLSVTDEATGTVFNEVPVMPVIGPLIARPVEEGQPGYVMFVHAPPVLHSGSRVTVVLDTFRQEHVSVQ